jgi:hypothetical protein
MTVLWKVSNNKYINETTALNRTLQVLNMLDHYLPLSTFDTEYRWTRVGCGTGDSGTTTWGTTKTFPTFPSITGLAANAWTCLRQASGAEVVFKVVSPEVIHMWWSPVTGYVSTGTSATVPPSTSGNQPADQVTMATSTAWFGDSAAHYMTMAQNNESFIMFGKDSGGSDVAYGIVFCKLIKTKNGDNQPFWAYIYGSEGNNVWNLSKLSFAVSMTAASYHPANGPQTYSLAEIRSMGSTYAFNYMEPDPITGNNYRFEALVGCNTAGSRHIRGVCPGIHRVDSTLGAGETKLDLVDGIYKFIGVGDYIVPWESSSDFL